MKKINLKKKLFLVMGIFVICSVLLCSIFSLQNKRNNVEVSNAVEQYVNSSDYINELIKPNKLYDKSYSLMTYYPLSAENQTTSNLCWIYSSLKVLESSFMVQKNEYHNFSEIGSAYLYYMNYTRQLDKEDSFKKIDITGNFRDFNYSAQNYGLIYESSFSNDIYFDIDESNYENYSYILDYVDTKIMKGVRPIDIHSDLTFSASNRDTKIQIMKEYILNYGGIFSGLERGIISSGIYHRTDNPSDSEYDGFIPTSHAVCIIGWSDDKEAFLALNSWGVSSSSYQTFYIPYNYAYMYNDVYGYICVGDDSSNLTTLSSTAGGADGFATIINSNFTDLSNFFVYGEQVELSFKISNVSKFDSVFVNIYSGLSNVTNLFSIVFDDDNQVINISSNDSASLAEGYFIEFSDEMILIGYQDFYVFTGTEVSYIELVKDSSNQEEDSTLFNNNLASGIFNQTYYVYNLNNFPYILNFYLPGINSYTKNNNNTPTAKIYELSFDENGNVSKEQSATVSISLESTGNTLNLFRFKISDLTKNNKGKFFLVSIIMSSKNTDAVTEYCLTLFISTDGDAKTEYANNIVYELDGGINNVYNVSRYPVYTVEDENYIKSYPLGTPTKFNSTFIGWYLDKDFTVEITEISPNIANLLGKILIDVDTETGKQYYFSELLGKEYSDDIVIYARWESENVNYFDISLSISEITDYYGNTTNYVEGQSIIYGDSVAFEFVFAPNFEKLTSYKYVSRYSYEFNNKEITTFYLDENGETIKLTNLFYENNLVCGEYSVKVSVVMIISHQFSLIKDISLTYTISPKDITVTFDEKSLSYIYDGEEHSPELSFNNVYDEDISNLEFAFDRDPVVNAGSYEFTVSHINNENYSLSGKLSETLNISTKLLSIEWFNTERVYNGSIQVPSYNVIGAVNDETVYVGFAETGTNLNLNMKDVGTYNISVVSISSSNYQFEGTTSCLITIKPAKITITFDNISERFTITPSHRKPVTYSVTGDLYDDVDSLDISYTTLGLTSTVSGVFPIIGNFDNDNPVNANYEATVVDGTYTILGYYYVYYTLPNGEIYIETVDDGYDPKGITNDIYKLPLFSKFEYDSELVSNGVTDLYIKVTIKSYANVVWIVAAIIGFVVVYYFASKKSRRNKTR